jgi:hypothetical protein
VQYLRCRAQPVLLLHVICVHTSWRHEAGGTLTVEALLLFATQSAAPIWNLRGVLCNSWHRVELDWRNESDVGQVDFRAELAQQLCMRFVIAGQHRTERKHLLAALNAERLTLELCILQEQLAADVK